MGTFGCYTGAEKISPEQIVNFTNALSKILYLGGMMQLQEVHMYDKEILLLDPVKIEKDHDVRFHYNYFEDDSWERAGYRYGKQHLYSNKIGWAEFNDVITAAHCLYELYDENPGLTEINGDIVDCEWAIGWINHILGEEFSLKNRYCLWSHAEQYAMERAEYNDLLNYSNLNDILPDRLWRYAKGTDLADLLYITLGTDTLGDDEICPGSYPEDILRCKNMIQDLLNDEGEDTGYESIVSLIKKDAKQRASIKDGNLRPLARISLELPARVLLYLAAELTKKDFWFEWKEYRGDVYHDEIMKQYASEELEMEREEGRSMPVEELPTAEYLKQTGRLTFYDTPDELKGEPNYILNDADRLYWWDGTDEVVIDEKTEEWLKNVGEVFRSIRDEIPEECDTQSFAKEFIELLHAVDERYKRVFAFNDMFYEFIENSRSKDYRAAIVYLSRLHEDNKESGSIIEKVRNWDVASKNVKCNSARMLIKRYLSLLANRKLREKYLGF